MDELSSTSSWTREIRGGSMGQTLVKKETTEWIENRLRWEDGRTVAGAEKPGEEERGRKKR